MRNLRQPELRRRIVQTNKIYATSKERIELLQNDIQLGESAEIALFFVESLLDQLEENILNELKKSVPDIAVLHMEYLAVNKLNEKINKAINEGKIKQKTLNKLLNKED